MEQTNRREIEALIRGNGGKEGKMIEINDMIKEKINKA